MSKIDFDQADETREFPNGKWEIVHDGDYTIARGTMEPGWKWSTDVKPLVGTDWCQQRHVGYTVAGRLKITMEDGSSFEIGPGETYTIEPGHDGEVAGDETYVGIEFSESSAKTYATNS